MYAKLVFRNAKRSVKDYLIYIVTMTICVTLFYSFLSISSRYYQPDIGSEYNFTILSDGMKAAICVITLFLLFLIRFVNHYMLRRKQKEFAVQSIMGMGQKTVGRLFFAETFMMGMYDVQISSRYNDVYDEENLPDDNYELVTDFLSEHGIETDYDCTFSLYLPSKDDFHNRMKYDFPVVAISLSDYNTIRKMLGYEPITLSEDEFTTQWQSIATNEERDSFLKEHSSILTDAGELTLSEHSFYEEAIGETAYNSYTDVLYVFPDSICENLLSVIRNRYIMTTESISYENARTLEQAFSAEYPEITDTGVSYAIRLSTLQVNTTKASNFVLQASMLYAAVVLMVICLTVLSLQQLLDASQYKYRFSVLRKLGVEDTHIGKLVLKQLGIWFGLPIVVAIIVSTMVIIYFIQTISAEISAYIGFGALMSQIGTTVSILALLLICYFISTWLLFKKSIK